MSSTVPEQQDCAVCLQKCHHPTQLPCGHIFCFLCVKGVAIQNRKCAMCRAVIPPDYLDHPILLEKLSPQHSLDNENTEKYQWYYEGRNGWWKYDERSNEELETAFNSEAGNCTLLLAGALYVIDFQNMIQMRRSDSTRRRKVKRDVPTLPAKGIAGIKSFSNQEVEQPKQDNDNNSEDTHNSQETNDSDIIEIDEEDDDDNDDVIVNESIDSSNSTSSIIDVFSSLNIVDAESPRQYSTSEDT